MSNISIPQSDLESILYRIEALENKDSEYVFASDEPQALDFVYPLNDTEFGERFNAKDDTKPTGWTETDAALLNKQDSLSNAWLIFSSNANQTFNYQKQFSITTTEYPTSFAVDFRGIALRGQLYSTNVITTFKLHANNSGSPSANDFHRVEIRWNTSTNVWETRGAISTGGTVSAGSWYSMGFVPLKDITIRMFVNKIAGGASTEQRVYIGNTNRLYGQQLLRRNSLTTVDYQNPWLSISGDHSTDTNTSVLSVESVDFSNIS